MRKKVNKKLIVALLSFVLLFGGTFGSSLAWLLDTSDDVQNTFSTSDINIELKESKLKDDGLTVDTTESVQSNTNYKMIPGWSIEKDPWARVLKDSEECYLFVKIKESSNFDDYMTYEINEATSKGDDFDGWAYAFTENEDHITYLYRVVDKDDIKDETKFYILKGNKVTVKDSVTKEMMDKFDTDKDGKLSDDEKKALPTLTFTAYATQLKKNNTEKFTVGEAWELATGLEIPN